MSDFIAINQADQVAGDSPLLSQSYTIPASGFLSAILLMDLPNLTNPQNQIEFGLQVWDAVASKWNEIDTATYVGDVVTDRAGNANPQPQITKEITPDIAGKLCRLRVKYNRAMNLGAVLRMQ